MFGRIAVASLALLTLGTVEPVKHPGASADIAAACGDRDGWSDPAPPAKIHGSSWYVGTCGITVVLVETKAGLVLIDT
ncbi:MAG: subclass B3 metallo-beta-lactamase, partial [Novosphingobium sp.]|nr:subclass B3 metallo-beta-lactamase [Novosphingobium sp.]